MVEMGAGGVGGPCSFPLGGFGPVSQVRGGMAVVSWCVAKGTGHYGKARGCLPW